MRLLSLPFPALRSPWRFLAGLAVAAAPLVAACDMPRVRDEMHPLVTDPVKRHPIGIAADTATLELPPAAGEPGARSQHMVSTMRFLRRYRQEAQGPLTVSVPRHRGPGIERRLEDIRHVARMTGIAPDRIRITSAGHYGGFVLLSYDRLAVAAPVCGDWSEDVTRNPDNIPYPNFGCASQRNLAHMIANPTDAVFPAQETPRMSDNRGAAWQRFKTGGSGTNGQGNTNATATATGVSGAAAQP